MTRLMKTLAVPSALLLALLSGLLAAAGGAQAQENLPEWEQIERAAEDTVRAAQDAADEFAAVLTGYGAALDCATPGSDSLRVDDLDAALFGGTIFCREIARDGEYRINPGAIGVQSVIERGVIHAYDLFGLSHEGEPMQRFDHPVAVCLKGRGHVVFLPVYAAPRPVQLPPLYPAADYTCARVGSAGIVALVSG